MRPLEIMIPVLLALHVIWRTPRPRLIRIFPVLALVGTMLHFAAEGFRWQMIPLYFLTVTLTALTWFGVELKRIGSFLTLILIVISTGLPVLLSVPSIPTPSGPYQVGTRIYELTDSTRQELYSAKADTCPGGRCQGARRFQI
jgi:hypothetical protein